MIEADLYPPLKRFLEGQGYEVKGEVGDCDVVARQGDEVVVVELKRTLTLKLVLQAVDRLALSEVVYICVPASAPGLKSDRKSMLKLLRMLGLGLVVVELDVADGLVEVALDPGEYRPKVSKPRQARLLGEFAHRVGDPNLGGSQGPKMTVFRQRALRLAAYLKESGPTKASVLAKELDDPKALGLLYRDVYGWFDRQGKGIYALSPRGEREAIGVTEHDASQASLPTSSCRRDCR